MRSNCAPVKKNIRNREVTIDGSPNHTATAPLKAPQARAIARTTINATATPAVVPPILLEISMYKIAYTPTC